MSATLNEGDSTSKQATKGYSLDSREELLREHCQLHGYEFAGEYVDDSNAGKNNPRAAFDRFCKALEVQVGNASVYVPEEDRNNG